MKLSLRTENMAVFDEVLDKEHFSQFISYFCGLSFAYRHSSGWQKVWRASDGDILSGQELRNTEPINCPIGWIYQNLAMLLQGHINYLVGEQGTDYDYISFTPYIYPVNSKISWHDDTGYAAAAIFYCHPRWSPNWGGELMVANVPPDVQPIAGAHNDAINRDHIETFLNVTGHGQYVAPLPNRLVVTKGGTWHQINRVDLSAGDHNRCSVVAFFKKNSTDS